MTVATEDPNDRGQKRLANYVPWSGTDYVVMMVEPILKFTQPAIAAYERDGQDIDKNMRAFLLYSFVAETNLKPSACCLIAKKTGDGGREYFFVPNNAAKRQSDRVDELAAEIAALQRQVAELQQENRDLRWKR